MKINRIALSALMASSALVPFSAAWGQESDPAQTDDVIVVRYQYVPDDKRVTSEVSSFLTIDDIATTGDGDIAAALGRVTGLSVSDGRFVIVRGLNERYSNTLINGSPLASPEPFRRAVPLDLFPTNLISNVLVQKTFSPEYPGDFGGGLLQIETTTLPSEGFVELGLSFAADTETSFQTGLLHDGGDKDWLGFEDGTREFPEQYVDIFNSQNIGPSEQDEILLAEIGRALPNAPLWLVQEGDIGGDVGGDLTLGDRYDFDNFSIGVIASVGYDNGWETRQGRRGKARVQGDGLSARTNLERFSTANTVESNGLFNLGAEIGDQHELNFLALVLRSTEKETRTLIGPDDDRDAVTRRDFTEYFERQVYTYQLSGEHEFNIGQGLGLDWRWSTSDASRNAPNQREALYEQEDDGRFRLLNGLDGNSITFTRVDEVTDEYGLDFTLPVTLLGLDWEWKAGYADLSKERTAYSRSFGFASRNDDPDLLFSRIDFIFADQNIFPSRFFLQEVGGVLTPEAYRGELNVDAWYVGTDVELTPFLRAALGVRFEDGEQIVDTFGFPNTDPTDIGDNEGFISEDYVLPAATLTWTFADNMQMRFGYSQTVVRPQFRELGFAEFFNTETDERFRGNPFLVNSDITNFDARFEWYFSRQQFFTAGIFYKDIDSPIVEYALREGETLATSFINAPSAEILGFELEFERRFDLSERFSGEFWENAEFFVKANYTFTDSEMAAGEGDTVIVAEPLAGDAVASVNTASGFINDGEALQGQSDHLANLQIGWEDENAGTRTALLLNFTGERTRALANVAAGLPAVVEEPPTTLDLVHSRSFDVLGSEFSARFAVRNLLGDDYVATQSAGDSSFVVDSYDIGRTFQFSLTRSF